MTNRTTKGSDLHLDDMLPYLMNRLIARMKIISAHWVSKRS